MQHEAVYESLSAKLPEFTFDRRHDNTSLRTSFVEGQAVRCLCHDVLHTPRPYVVQVYEAYDREMFLRALADKVGIYFCPVCKQTDSDSYRHALESKSCVLQAQARTAGGGI
jgi:hypothetical protein